MENQELSRLFEQFKEPAKLAARPRQVWSVETLVKPVALMKARGTPNHEIAEAFEVSPEKVQEVISQPNFIKEFGLVQASLGLSFDERLGAAAEMALDRQVEILFKSKDYKSLAALTDKVIDRAKGKAVNRIEVSQRNFTGIKDLAALEDAERAIDASILALETRAS